MLITENEYIDQLTEYFAKKVLKFTPQIFSVSDLNDIENTIEPFSSSILMRADNRFFLISAGHVLKKKNQFLGFFEQSSFYLLNEQRIFIDPDQDNESLLFDIGACELTEDSISWLTDHYDFLDINELNFDYQPKNDKGFLIVGYPWRKTKVNTYRQTIKDTPWKFLTHEYFSSQLGDLNQKRDSIHILEYRQRKIIDSKSGYYRKSTKLHGLSGCGVWHLPDVFADDFSKLTCNLTGILIREDEFAEKYVITTRLKMVGEFLRQLYDLNIEKDNTINIDLSTKANSGE